MNHTITVTGVGKASAAPDEIVFSLGLESVNQDYEKAMDTAAEQIE